MHADSAHRWVEIGHGQHGTKAYACDPTTPFLQWEVPLVPLPEAIHLLPFKAASHRRDVQTRKGRKTIQIRHRDVSLHDFTSRNDGSASP